MPIEIKELIIKTTFEDSENNNSLSETDIVELKNNIINECIDQVLDIIKEKHER